MTKTWKTWLAAACLAAYGPAARGQTPPVTIIEITVQDYTIYLFDTLDPARIATIRTPTTPVPPSNFRLTQTIGDVVAVNGKPAKGTITERQTSLLLRTNPVNGQGIADGFRNQMQDETVELLNEDGRSIGTFMLSGLAGGDAPPGAPLGSPPNNGFNMTITGGTGAFFGLRGLKTLVGATGAIRVASITEDPGQRRALGSRSTLRVRFYLYPMFWPKITSVMHENFSPVTAASPARAGEVLNLRATGLGPLRSPGVDPGAPFPEACCMEINSPVEATVNGQSAVVINKVGWPGTADSYFVQIRLPDGIAGTAKVLLSAAWILGEEATFPVQ